MSWSISEGSEMPIFGSDVPISLRNYLTEALTEIFQVQGSGATKLHEQIFNGTVSGGNYKKWFLSRVKKIVMTGACGVTAKIDSDGEPGVIYISRCVNLRPDSRLKFYWISILFHEARHLEPQNNYWKHEICLDSSNNVSACDSNVEGAFGLEKVISKNVARYCTNCSEDFLKQAIEVYEDSTVWEKLSGKAMSSLESDLVE